MAKRYLTYEQLQQLPAEKTDYKIPGTLGRHKFIYVQAQDSVTVTGYDSAGTKTNSVRVRAGETLGYNVGNVWVVPNPDDIKDPLRRAMLRNRISRDRLVWVDSLDDVPMDTPTRFQREGYKAFFDGEVPGASDDKVCITIMYRFIRPVEQRKYWNKIYAVKGTPREYVAQFIETIFSSDPDVHTDIAMTLISDFQKLG